MSPEDLPDGLIGEPVGRVLLCQSAPHLGLTHYVIEGDGGETSLDVSHHHEYGEGNGVLPILLHH